MSHENRSSERAEERNAGTAEGANATRVRSRRQFLGRSAVAGASLLALTGGAGAALAAELNEQGEATRPTAGVSPAINGGAIQALVDDASAGDVVVVPPGTYAEHVTIDKAITLQGNGAVTLDARGLHNGIRIESSDVTVDGFDIKGDDGTATGIEIVLPSGGLSDITIQNNQIRGMAKSGGGTTRQSWGILSWGDGLLSDIDILNNRIERIGGQKGSDPQGCGICLIGVSGSSAGSGGTIVGNTIRNIANGNLGNPFSGGFSNLFPFGVGIAIQPLDASGPAGVDVTNNTLAAPANVVLGNLSSSVSSEITGNYFSARSKFGVVNANTNGDSLNAENNYWGHVKGPRAIVNNPQKLNDLQGLSDLMKVLRGNGTAVVGDVDYDPWLKAKDVATGWDGSGS